MNRGPKLELMDRRAIVGALTGLPRRWRDRRDDMLTAATAGWAAARTWRLTATEQALPPWTFNGYSANEIERHVGDRLYCIYRADWEARAAVAFDLGGGPGGSLLISELALAHQPGSPDERDLHALAAAVMLLDRLHDLAVAHELESDIWAVSSYGCSHEQFEALGFHGIGSHNGDPGYVRRDPEDRAAHPGRGLELLRAWHRIRSGPR